MVIFRLAEYGKMMSAELTLKRVPPILMPNGGAIVLQGVQ